MKHAGGLDVQLPNQGKVFPQMVVALQEENGFSGPFHLVAGEIGHSSGYVPGSAIRFQSVCKPIEGVYRFYNLVSTLPVQDPADTQADLGAYMLIPPPDTPGREPFVYAVFVKPAVVAGNNSPFFSENTGCT